MKQLFFLLAIAVSSVIAKGESFSTLSFETIDGKVISLPVENLEISIADGILVAGADGAQTVNFNLEDLKAMQFSTDTPTNITSITSDHAGTVTIFRPDGVVVGFYQSLDVARKALSPGIYIVKDQNANSLKISIK